MPRLSCSLLVSLPIAIGCATQTATDDPDGVDSPSVLGPQIDAAWIDAPTLHIGARVFDRAAANSRKVYPVWIAGSATDPVSFDVTASSTDSDVRVAVLGPLDHGARAVIGTGGYASPRTNVEITALGTMSGEYLIVAGSFDLVHDTSYDLEVHCEACAPSRLDVLDAPKAGALVAMADDRVVQARLGEVLAQRTFDVEVELWASPPARSDEARKVAAGVASGTQVNVIVPASVHAGDDLTLVIREAGGRVLDTGVITRFAPQAAAFARTDCVRYGDLDSVEISGVVGFFEGEVAMSLRSEQRHVELAEQVIRAALPGHVGNGWNAFDATFTPARVNGDGELAPDLPHDGELLSVGYIGGGDGAYHRLGCFEYCNDLSGMGGCTGGPRACPSATW